MKDVHQIIEQLSPADASAILHALATSDEALAARIAEMALVRFDQIDVEEVSATLYDELDALAVEEVWDRAGSTRYGYVEPSEAADQMIEAALAPFLEDPARYQKLGLRIEANRMCEGLLLGFYRFQQLVATQNPASSVLGYDDDDLLRAYGALSQPKGETGWSPTVAGVLMFGTPALTPALHLLCRRKCQPVSPGDEPDRLKPLVRKML